MPAASVIDSTAELKKPGRPRSKRVSTAKKIEDSTAELKKPGRPRSKRVSTAKKIEHSDRKLRSSGPAEPFLLEKVIKRKSTSTPRKLAPLTPSNFEESNETPSTTPSTSKESTSPDSGFEGTPSTSNQSCPQDSTFEATPSTSNQSRSQDSGLEATPSSSNCEPTHSTSNQSSANNYGFEATPSTSIDANSPDCSSKTQHEEVLTGAKRTLSKSARETLSIQGTLRGEQKKDVGLSCVKKKVARCLFDNATSKPLTSGEGRRELQSTSHAYRAPADSTSSDSDFCDLDFLKTVCPQQHSHHAKTSSAHTNEPDRQPSMSNEPDLANSTTVEHDMSMLFIAEQDHGNFWRKVFLNCAIVFTGLFGIMYFTGNVCWADMFQEILNGYQCFKDILNTMFNG